MGILKFTYLLLLPLVPKIDADLLWELTQIFSGLGIIYLVIAFVFRNRILHKNKAVRQRKKELGPMISNFLFYEDDVSLQEKYNHVQLKLDIRELLKDNFNRKVLVEILLDLQKDISGDARFRLFSLYKDLGLHLDAFQKLKSWRWEIISQAILELTQLQVEESYGFIKKFINHRKGVIRKQAQMATVSLKHEGIVYFLDTCKYRISEWQQLKLLNEIRNLEDFQPPRFKAWLTAKNKDVVLFSLRLIKYYKQNDANSSLIQLVKHNNDQIKIEAINCIKEFVVFEALDTLKTVFWKCSPSVKLVLLDTVASLGEDNEIPFLKMVENKENNFMVKSKALSAINTISPETVLPTHGIDAYPDYDASQEVLDEIPAPNSKEITEEIVKSPVAEEENVQKEKPLSIEEQIIGFTKDIATDWQVKKEGQQLINDTDINKTVRSEVGAQQELLFPESEEVGFNLSEENIMEHREEIEFDSDDIFEALRKNEPQQTDLTDLNSEEAYWEAVLDPEYIDESIFEVCFMEELDEILSITAPPKQGWAPDEILPLDFLPIIAQDNEENTSVQTRITDPLWNIEVNEEVVHQDELFAEELQRILNRIKKADDAEQQDLTDDFIPFVIDAEADKTIRPIAQSEEELQSPEVNEDVQTQAIEEELEEIILPWENNQSSTEDKADQLSLPDIDLEYEEVVSAASIGASANDEQEALFELNAVLEDRVSIFNELFRTCDAESKLILLDEILAVGDERDLKFLDTLSNDEDQRVRRKALAIAEKLEEYLNSISDNKQENSSQKSDHKTTIEGQMNAQGDLDSDLDLEGGSTEDIFDIDFQLDTAVSDEVDSDASVQKEEELTSSVSNNILDEILSFPAKLMDKLNG
ncbi:hypothetical protein [Muriicola sp. Z0-33]|uniref:hypothetical protein n=1 Tax=Muriicola sp. Z0-33 TaxID=2816957 RepID=UPI002237F37F|nr:hypothetical protein [Muriicola sp. Z0-33]MCW5515195.1 hypothetical protein [Muriicola sp. Z0-33]